MRNSGTETMFLEPVLIHILKVFCPFVCPYLRQNKSKHCLPAVLSEALFSAHVPAPSS